jgi:PadR family transcriptional regulator, regulatory protein AphA
MLKKVNKTKYAILGMLIEQPLSGYEIKQEMLETTAHFWQESDASIYPMLKTLESEGLVTSHSEFVGKRARNIFEVTDAGKQEFEQWLALPAEGETRRNELLLKIFLGGNGTPDETINQLTRHEQKIARMEQQFKNIEETVLTQVSDSHPHKIYWTMALRNGIISVTAEKEWVAECFKMLKKNKKNKKTK